MFSYSANCERDICQVYDYECKYILTALLGEYSTFRIYLMFVLIKCVIGAENLSRSDAVDFHIRSGCSEATKS